MFCHTPARSRGLLALQTGCRRLQRMQTSTRLCRERLWLQVASRCQRRTRLAAATWAANTDEPSLPCPRLRAPYEPCPGILRGSWVHWLRAQITAAAATRAGCAVPAGEPCSHRSQETGSEQRPIQPSVLPRLGQTTGPSSVVSHLAAASLACMVSERVRCMATHPAVRGTRGSGCQTHPSEYSRVAGM